MNQLEHPGLEKLRFNSEIKSFSPLLSRPDAVAAAGKKVIGCAPLSPLEPIIAAGGFGYDPFTNETLFHSVYNRQFSLVDNAIESGLSPDFNMWNLIAAGAVAAGKTRVPINAFATICGWSDDQTKKSMQAMASGSGSPIYFWEVPRYTSEFSGWAVDYIVKELRQLFFWLTTQTGKKITDDRLIEAIKLNNLLRHDIKEIVKLQQLSPGLMPSLEYYFILSTAGGLNPDGEKLHRLYQSFIGEISGRVTGAVNNKKPRIYWLGEDTQELQIFNEIDDLGATLVGSDARLSFYYEPIRETGNPVENLADWLWRMPCNMSSAERMNVTIPHIKAQNPDYVIINSNCGSRNLPGAEALVTGIVRKQLGLPVLSIETSLPGDRFENVKSQLQQFIKLT